MDEIQFLLGQIVKFLGWIANGSSAVFKAGEVHFSVKKNDYELCRILRVFFPLYRAAQK